MILLLDGQSIILNGLDHNNPNVLNPIFYGEAVFLLEFKYVFSRYDSDISSETCK